MIADGIVWTCLGTFAAFFAFVRINIGFVASKGNRAEFTGVQTFVAETFLAVVRNDKALDGTLCTGTVKDLDQIVC